MCVHFRKTKTKAIQKQNLAFAIQLNWQEATPADHARTESRTDSMLTKGTEILQEDECVPKYAKRSHSVYPPHWAAAEHQYETALSGEFLHTLTFIHHVTRPLGSKPSSLAVAQEPDTWFVAQVTEENVGNCKQWLKKERKKGEREKCWEGSS